MAAKNTRMRVIVAGGAVAVLLAVLATSVLGMRANARHEIEQGRKDLGRLQALAAEYGQLRAERERLASGGNRAQGTLYAILDGILRRMSLSGKVRFMKPGTRETANGAREEVVSLGIQGMYGGEFVALLHEVEVGAGGLFVDEASLRKTKDGLLDMDLTVSMLVPEG